MQYIVRIALGALLGAVVAVPLAIFVHVLWWAAGFGALAAAIGFLGSFFVWSADRAPTATDPGYEQVLFDRPNTIVSAVLMLVLAGSVVGYGLVAASSLPPEVEAALAQVDSDESRLTELASQYKVASDDYLGGKRTGDVVSSDLVLTLRDARALAAEVKGHEHPESFAKLDAALAKGVGSLVAAIEALNKCAMGDEPACLDARLAYADVVRAQETLAAERAALGLD